MFLWAVFWAIVGLITTLLWGIDIPKFVADLIVLIVVAVGPIIFITFQGYMDIDKTVEFLESYIINFVQMLPGLVIGDTVGTCFGKVKEIFG